MFGLTFALRFTQTEHFIGVTVQNCNNQMHACDYLAKFPLDMKLEWMRGPYYVDNGVRLVFKKLAS